MRVLDASNVCQNEGLRVELAAKIPVDTGRMKIIDGLTNAPPMRVYGRLKDLAPACDAQGHSKTVSLEDLR